MVRGHCGALSMKNMPLHITCSSERDVGLTHHFPLVVKLIMAMVCGPKNV